MTMLGDMWVLDFGSAANTTNLAEWLSVSWHREDLPG